MYNIHVCIEFSRVLLRGEEAAVIVQAESDTGKASMHHAPLVLTGLLLRGR